MSELEASLREGGEKVTQGRIRIDADRALQRLRDFRFADPAHWVLEVLRAAVASGAKKVTVRTDADDVEVAFDGRPFPKDAMEHLLEQALNPGATDDEQRTRLLALGVAGALGVGASFVTVASHGVRLRLTAGGVTREDGGGKGTTLHLHKAFGWRVASAFFRGSPEAAAILERARRFPVALSLNGASVPATRPFPPGGLERTTQKAGWRLVVHLPDGPPRDDSLLDLDVGGVLVAQRRLELPGVQVLAWLRADGLRRNASGSDVVDDDATLRVALKELEQLSLDLLSLRTTRLADDDVEWRARLLEWLLTAKARGPRAATILRQARLIPGPAGEWNTLDAVTKAAEADGRLYVATKPYQKGAYPPLTVLLPPGSELKKLLPLVKHLDVADLVKQKARIAERRQQFEESPVEAATLPERSWVLKGPITGGQVAGEVGFQPGTHGAFVRVLHQGRLLEATEVPSLAPLRLRAVIDWQRPLSDAYFDPLSQTKVASLVAMHVEEAATQAVLSALPAPEALPFALELLQRLCVVREVPAPQLPAALRATPLFLCLEGDAVSLDTLATEQRWRFVSAPWPHPPLDGSRVLVLSAPLKACLEALGKGRMEDVTAQLQHELAVRRRLAGPKEKPALPDAVAEEGVTGEDLWGVVGVPRGGGNKLALTVLRDGFKLEQLELSARYHHAVAAVECPALTPNARWTGAVRDAAWRRVTDAVTHAQRRLAAKLAAKGQRLEDLPQGAQLFLRAFFEKELTPFHEGSLDEVSGAVADAPLFDTTAGLLSLRALAARVRREGSLLNSPPDAGRPPSDLDFTVVLERPVVVALLAEALGLSAEDATPRLVSLAARRRVESWPQVDFALPAGLCLPVRFQRGGAVALAGLAPGLEAAARVQVLIRRRSYALATLPCALPLCVVVDVDDLEPTHNRELSGDQRAFVSGLVGDAVLEVVARALKDSSTRDARRALLCAVARRVDASLPEAQADALRAAPLFPCTDGEVRSVAQLEAAQFPVQHVSAALEGTLPDRRPIVLARDEELATGLKRWSQLEAVDDALRAQNAALEARQAMRPVEKVSLKADTPWRLAVDETLLVGEVAVVREGAGRLELLHERRPLCVVEGALPLPLAAAVDARGLTPKPGFTGVVENEGFKRVVDTVRAAGTRLATVVAQREAPRGFEAARVQLAFWVASAHAWEWKGKKKARGKKKSAKKVEAAAHPLLQVPLLRSTTDAALPVQALLDAQQANGKVEYALEGGALLEPGRVVWWPRAGELAAAEALHLGLTDVTKDVQFAGSIRARPRFDRVTSPQPGPWREPVQGPGLEGEVAVGDAPDRTLVIEVLHQRTLLERWVGDHAVGGLARVDGSHLEPNDDWTAAKRNASFKDLRAHVEAALERLVARRLATRDAAWRAWATAALASRRSGADALSAVVPGLPLFRDAAGAPVTVGAVLARRDAARRVAVVEAGLAVPAGPELVLTLEADTRSLLEALQVESDDVTGELRRAASLQQALTARRLATLAWKGEAVLRRKLETAQLSGELALSSAPGDGRVTLCREGIAVQDLDETWPGVVGVVEVAGLAVNDDWTQATLTRPQRQALRDEVEQLFQALADDARTLPPVDREAAAHHALRRLGELGVEAPAHLDRMTGAARALCDAPLFVATDGELVSLHAVAAEMEAKKRVAVMTKTLLAPEVGEHLVLAASSQGVAWLGALERLFGKPRVWRVTDLSEWRAVLAEADPLDGTPEAWGLRFLRRELRLLRAGALGHLTPDDLEDVRLHRAGGGEAMRYDGKRKLALLDPAHPLIAKTLAEARQRPERVWVLLAALFGLVNRALHHVTDPHEAQLVLALAGHLAANPKLLGDEPAGP